MKIRTKIEVYGIVQGVGFRPFIHRLVLEHNICGIIRNTPKGAEIEAEGIPADIENFTKDIAARACRPIVIERIESEPCDGLEGYLDFSITESRADEEKKALVSPDIAICKDCLRELFDPSDRRCEYPFINCTNCGPRFTIIKDIPYDRKNTSMSHFEMCKICAAEYGNIKDRRYHAQPDCCKDCGPQVFFYVNPVSNNKSVQAQSNQAVSDSESVQACRNQAVSLVRDGVISSHDCFYDVMSQTAGRKSAGSVQKDILAVSDGAIIKAIQYLNEGKITAIKGLGGFHLACRADDENAALRLRRRKHRDEKPFAIMVRDVQTAGSFCHVNEDEKRLLENEKCPIVLLEKINKDSYKYLSENNYIGVMLPYTPLHHLLFYEKFFCEYDALIMTSANISGLPIIYKNEHAIAELSGIADGILMHSREIETRCDDSLLWAVNGQEYFVRRSRGYVPLPLTYDGMSGFARQEQKAGPHEKTAGPHEKTDTEAYDMVLACGAEQKASFALKKQGHIFPSQYMGDLKNAETLENYEGQIRHFEKLFDIKPQVIACDLHPEYLSTAYAQQRAEKEGLKLIKIQHHHAHMASCMTDNGIEGPCIGIIWDGTGAGAEYNEHMPYGQVSLKKEIIPDGTIWGGEFLTGDFLSFRRCASILPFRLPGGDRAAEEPWRCALSLLSDSFADDGHCPYLPQHSDSGFLRLIDSSADYGQYGGINCKDKPEGSTLAPSCDYACFYPEQQVKTVKYLLDNNINSPFCTSMGRLFDGAASLLGIKQEVSYEGQAAVLLEACAQRYAQNRECQNEGYLSEEYRNKECQSEGYLSEKYQNEEYLNKESRNKKYQREKFLNEKYPYEIIKTDRYYFDFRPMFRQMTEDISPGSKLSFFQSTDINTGYADHLQCRLAAKFLNTLSDMAAEISMLIRADTKINKIVLSGGSFQNMYLLKKMTCRLKECGFEVFHHKNVPANDEGISLGQAAIAVAASAGLSTKFI